MKVFPIGNDYVDYEIERNPWKERFTNDVLTQIDKGWRYVGWYDVCIPCLNCYSFGPDLCIHDDWDFINYENFNKLKIDPMLIIYNVPLENFKWMFPTNGDYSNFAKFMNFKKELEDVLPNIIA